MTIGRDIIGNLAKQFGYSKELVRDALASNQIDPLTASLIGSRIDKMQQIKQQAASQTTVMEDVLAPKPEEVMQSKGIAAAPQQAPSALAALPSNLPTEGMAGGGIVAFADGGELDDEDEDEEKEKSTLSQLMNGLSSGLRSITPQNFAGIKTEKGISAPGLTYKEPLPRGGEEGLKVPKSLVEYVLQKESGGRRYDKEGNLLTSPKGARGEMQVMPGTSRDPGFGVTPAKDNSPEELARVGRDYLNAMYKKYDGNKKLAAMAYNWGPGNVDSWLSGGANPKDIPEETRKYIAGLAEGGITSLARGGVVAFQNTGLVKGEKPISAFRQFFEPTEKDREFAENYIAQQQRQRDIEKQLAAPELDLPFYKAVKPSERAEIERKRNELMAQKTMAQQAQVNPTLAAPTGTPMSQMEAQDVQEGLGATPTFDKLMAAQPQVSQEQIDKLIGGTPGGEKEDGLMKKYLSLLEGREKASTEQRKTDAYLSLLSAGLGIMGGTSPFAATNIGQGAQAGVATQMGARKAQIAEEAATLKGFGTAAAAEEYAKQRQLLASQAQEGKVGNLIANREKQLETVAYNNLVKGNINFAMLEPAQQQAAIAGETQRLKSADPLLTKLYQQYGLPPIQAAAPAKPLTKDELLAQRKAEKDRLGIK